MIYVKLISGLGNQLFQYVLGRKVSILKKTSLKLDVSFFENQDLRSYKLNHYNINAAIATDDEIENIIGIYTKDDIYSKVYRRAEKLLPKHYKRYFKEDKWWLYEPDVLKTFPNVYLDGYWQHYKYFEHIDTEIFNELTLKDTTECAGYNIFEQVKQDNSSVSIHIRRGDYIDDPEANNLMGVLPLQYYNTAIERIKEKVNNSRFYVFSDDLNWAQDNFKINFPVTFVDIANGSKDYLELDLMSKCRHNIIANSTFGWWGAFLNQNPDKIIIAPSKWVQPVHINSKIELQFPSWVKI